VGLYLRRSVRVGPLRFNFSKSGIGVSTGIPGFRIGSGPRGAYVHMGAGGLYYRQSLGTHSGRASRRAGPDGVHPSSHDTIGPMVDVDSAPVSEMADASSDDLLEELRAKRSIARITPWVIGVGLFVLYMEQATGVPDAPLLANAIVLVLLALVAGARDSVRRTAVVGYDLDDQAAEAYEGLIDAVKALGSAGGLWHIPSTAQVYDGRYPRWSWARGRPERS
jgi:hypothetical protein